MTPILSILTPAVPSRFALVERLCAELANQIGELPVEHLVLIDNKRRTVGEKRDALLRASRGDYVAYVDDDDWIAPDYVRSLAAACCGHREAGRLGEPSLPEPPDVVTFEQECTVNGQKGKIDFRLYHDNEPFKPDGVAFRNAWHICAWRRALAICSHFPPINYGEDWVFASRLCAMQGLREEHIPRVLHFYHHDAATTEAPAPGGGSPKSEIRSSNCSIDCR